MPPTRSIVAALVACVAACGPSGPRPAADPDLAHLPPFTASDAALLDDRLSAEVFGGEAEAADPVGRRAALADGIMRAKVVTVTRDSTGQAESFVITLAPLPPALKGPSVSESLSLSIPPTNPSFGFVKSFEAELVGRVVILLYKRYAEDGESTLRWRIEADTPRVNRAIDQARIMGELRR